MKGKSTFTQLGFGSANLVDTDSMEIKNITELGLQSSFLIEKTIGPIILNNGKKFIIDDNVWSFFGKTVFNESFLKTIDTQSGAEKIESLENVGKISIFKNVKKRVIPKGYLRTFDLGKFKNCILVENIRDGFKLGLVLPVWIGTEIKSIDKDKETIGELGTFFVKNWEVTPGKKSESAGGFIDANQLLNKYALEIFLGNNVLFNTLAFVTESKFARNKYTKQLSGLETHKMITLKAVESFTQKTSVIIDGELVYWQFNGKSDTELETGINIGFADNADTYCGGNVVKYDNPGNVLEHNGDIKINSALAMPSVKNSIQIITSEQEENYAALIRLPSTKILKGVFDFKGGKQSSVRSLRSKKNNETGITEAIITTNGLSNTKDSSFKIAEISIEDNGTYKVKALPLSIKDTYVLYQGAISSVNGSKCILGFDFENHTTDLIKYISYRKTGKLPGGIMGSVLGRSDSDDKKTLMQLTLLSNENIIKGKISIPISNISDTYDSISALLDLKDGYLILLDNRGYERKNGSNQIKQVNIFNNKLGKSISFTVNDFIETKENYFFLKEKSGSFKIITVSKTNMPTTMELITLFSEEKGYIPIQQTNNDSIYKYQPRFVLYEDKPTLVMITEENGNKIFELSTIDEFGFKRVTGKFKFPENCEILGFSKFGNPKQADFKFGIKRKINDSYEEGYCILENMTIKNFNGMKDGWFVPGNKLIEYHNNGFNIKGTLN